MKYARKVALLPLRPRSNPRDLPKLTDNVTTKILSEIGQNMEGILANNNLTAEDRMNIHYRLLQRLRHYIPANRHSHRPIQQPIEQPIQNPAQNAFDQPDLIQFDDDEDEGAGAAQGMHSPVSSQVSTLQSHASSIVGDRDIYPPSENILWNIPLKDHAKVEAILKAMLQSNGELGWNEDYELTVRGRAVPNSNIGILLNDYLAPTKQKNPNLMGHQYFQNGIAQLPGLGLVYSPYQKPTKKVTRSATAAARKAAARKEVFRDSPYRSPYEKVKKLRKRNAQEHELLGVPNWTQYSQK
jgi:hypothetical protein